MQLIWKWDVAFINYKNSFKNANWTGIKGYLALNVNIVYNMGTWMQPEQTGTCFPLKCPGKTAFSIHLTQNGWPQVLKKMMIGKNRIHQQAESFMLKQLSCLLWLLYYILFSSLSLDVYVWITYEWKHSKGYLQ